MGQVIDASRDTTWTGKKFAFAGIVVVAMLILWGIAKLVLVVAMGLPNASPANLFTLPLLAVLSMLLIQASGAMVLPILVFALLEIPLPSLGGPGNLLKVPILVIPFIAADLFFWLLRRRPELAATASGALAGAFIGAFLSGTFGAEGAASHGLGLTVLGVNVGAIVLGLLEGGIGGFLAYRIGVLIIESRTVQSLVGPRSLPQPAGTATASRRIVFMLAVLLTVGFAGLFGGMVVLMNVIPGFMGMAHFSDPAHRIHDLTFAMLNGTAVVGMLAQLRAPKRNVAGQLAALIPFASLLFAAVLTNAWVVSPPWLILGASTGLAAMFHPAGDPTRALSAARVDRVMLAVVVVAVVPLLAYAWTNIGLQRSGLTDHVMAGHYGFMAALSITVIGVGLVAAARPAGWRVAAWVTGGLATALGLASLAFPVDSSLALVWALGAVAWGVAFIAVAEGRRRRAG
jgi:hypothetical protein